MPDRQSLIVAVLGLVLLVAGGLYLTESQKKLESAEAVVVSENLVEDAPTDDLVLDLAEGDDETPVSEPAQVAAFEDGEGLYLFADEQVEAIDEEVGNVFAAVGLDEVSDAAEEDSAPEDSAQEDVAPAEGDAEATEQPIEESIAFTAEEMPSDNISEDASAEDITVTSDDLLAMELDKVEAQEAPTPLTSEKTGVEVEEKEFIGLNPDVEVSEIVIIKPSGNDFYYDANNEVLDVETVLVPHQEKVISSPRDGKISNIYFKNGDSFKRGDVLLEYDCRDLLAEARIAQEERRVTGGRRMKSERLFRLDIISDIDYLGLTAEANQARFRESLFDVRMDTCRIVAPFNGRITDRLSNPGEYTRTDRVLLQIASDEPLQAEFLIPSKWLRYVDVGAPLEIIVNETGRSYRATISRIYGEVDPVSQSIQVVAALAPYQDPLLPGMSGVATLDVKQIRDAGVLGFLEPK